METKILKCLLNDRKEFSHNDVELGKFIVFDGNGLHVSTPKSSVGECIANCILKYRIHSKKR